MRRALLGAALMLGQCSCAPDASFVVECDRDSSDVCLSRCSLGGAPRDSGCSYHAFKCFDGIGANGTAGCDCDRFYGCTGPRCHVSGHATRFERSRSRRAHDSYSDEW